MCRPGAFGLPDCFAALLASVMSPTHRIRHVVTVDEDCPSEKNTPSLEQLMSD
jgi:hypothetical protein